MSHSYDALGNLASKSDVGSYASGSAGNGTGSGPHQARTVAGQALSYDANGNLLSGRGRTFTWTAENLPASVTSGGATETYRYDADGERVLRTAGGVTTYSFQGLWDMAGSASTRYYSFHGQVVAMRDSSGVTYLHGDHLGSISWQCNSAGQQVGGQEYGPWGAVRAVSGSLASTSLNYTGQRLDGTGLLYDHARSYDPVLARFVSADSQTPDYPNPQDLNLHTYVHNNPIRYADPTGHCIPGISDCPKSRPGGWSVGMTP